MRPMCPETRTIWTIWTIWTLADASTRSAHGSGPCLGNQGQGSSPLIRIGPKLAPVTGGQASCAAGQGVRTLLEATAGNPATSARYQEIFRPLWLEDELRAVLRSRGVSWGFMCLLWAHEPPADAPRSQHRAELVLEP